MFVARYPQRVYEPCPEGVHQGVCVDVVDLGLVATNFGEQFRVRIAWQIEQLDPSTGRRFDCVKSFRNSLHLKANLRAAIEAMRRKKFTETEARNFDLDSLVGINTMLRVEHHTGSNGKVYADVVEIQPAANGAPKLVPLNYVRAKDRRQGRNGGSSRTASSAKPEPATAVTAVDPDDPMPVVSPATDAMPVDAARDDTAEEIPF